MIPLTFTERHRQAQLYAAQVRVRRGMGDRYAHAAPLRQLRVGYLEDIAHKRENYKMDLWTFAREIDT